MACCGSFSSCEENDPDPMLGRDLDPDKLIWSTSCQKYVTGPAFLRPFLWFLSPIPRLLQLTLMSFSGSVPVERPNKIF